MGNTIFENEKNTILKIAEIIKEQGEKRDDNNLIVMHIPGELKTLASKQRVQEGTEYIIKNENGTEIELSENDEMIELRKNHPGKGGLHVSVAYDKTTSQIAYYLDTTRQYGYQLLALVGEKENYFPVWGEEGKLPNGEVRSTVREIIEEPLLKHRLLEHPPYSSEDAREGLNGFDEILSLDKERDIKPLTDEELEILKLKEEVDVLKKQISSNKELLEKSEDENNKYKKRIAILKEEKEKTEKENGHLKTTVSELMEKVKKIPIFGKRIIREMQTMLPEGNGENLDKNGKKISAQLSDREKFTKSLEFDDTQIGQNQNENENESGKPKVVENKIIPDLEHADE